MDNSDRLSQSSATPGLLKSRYFLIACAAAIIYILYWSYFSLNAYNTYHYYTDLGLFTYDMYYHIHFASIIHGLQYLIFANHIAPDQFLILPIFALFPSPVTLPIIQAIILSITGIVIFLVSRDMIKNEKISLFLCLAFLLNPGTFGLLIFDYHTERMIPLFLILSFYFYFNRRPYLFAFSFLLLLGTIEVAPVIALAFAFTMSLYAILREKDAEIRKDWLKYSALAGIASILVLVLYLFIMSSLDNAYATGQYPNLPPTLDVLRVFSQQTTTVTSLAAFLQRNPYDAVRYLFYAFLIVFAGFGIAGFFDPIFAILFAAPWLFEVFVVGNSFFLFPWYQYFGFTLGGSIIVAILALKNTQSKSACKYGFSFLKYGSSNAKVLAISIPIFIMVLLLLWPYMIYSTNIRNFEQIFLFYTNQSEQQQINQLIATQ